MRVIIFLFSVLSFSGLFAQKEANNWYFGNKAAFHFNTTSGNPVAVSNNVMNTLEGCSSISDRLTGALLFYTDGRTVYNRNHSIMTNGSGLQGHSSSSHSSVVVPFPGNHKKFYIFTVPTSSTVGAKYSVVDMTQSSGLGSVLNAQKNVQLAQSSTNSNAYPVADKCAAIGHSNGRDYWVVVQHNTTWSFYAYLVTSSGVSNTPVISTVTAAWARAIPHYGCIKISPDGKKLAAAYASARSVLLFDFNSSTGAINNQITLTKQSGYLPYGLEFAPNSKLLYVNSRGVQQLDVYAGTASQILASEKIISTNAKQGQLQLAPDLKIYWSPLTFGSGSRLISRIDSPNVVGTQCAFRDTGIVLTTNAAARLGLPTFIQSFFITTTLSVKDACDSSWVKISVKDTSAVDSVLYNYGDPSTGRHNTSWNKLDSHRFSKPAKYIVTAYPFYTDKKGKVVRDTLTDTVDVLATPIVSLGNDTTVCIFDSLEAKVLNTSTYELWWMDSTQRDWHRVDSTGKYWVTAFNRCGYSRDTVKIDSLFKRKLNLGRDTVLCRGDSIVLDISDTNSLYLWQDSTTNPVYTITKPGLYWGMSLNMCGIKGDTIRVGDDSIPTPDLGNDTAFCNGFVFVKDAKHWGSSPTGYLWSDGTPSSRNWVRRHGDLWVEVRNQCGKGSDTVYVGIHDPLKIELGIDTVICQGDTIVKSPFGKNNPTKDAVMLWSTGSTDSVLKISSSGTYWLRATNSCGSVSDTVKVEIETKPQVVLPLDTTKCEGDSIQLAVSYSRSTYRWQDGSTSQTYLVKKAGTYWVEVSNICGKARDQVVYKYDKPLSVELGADTIICDSRGFEKKLNLPGNPSYFWSTGSRTNVGVISGGGRYSVTATNVCGMFTDDIDIEHLYKPTPKLGNDTVVCHGEVIKLSVSLEEKQRRGTVTTWQGKYKRKEFKVNSSGIYRVEVSNVCGVGGDTIELEFQALPKVGVSRDTSACNGKLAYDLRKYDYNMLWQDGSKRKRYFVKEPGVYSVELWDALGCYNKESFEVKECPTQFWAPNAFTPNRDGRNETWRVYKTEIYDFHMIVINRWNEIVFESSDITEEWTGVRQGTDAECPVGQYTYKVGFKEKANKQFQEVIGKVNLVR